MVIPKTFFRQFILTAIFCVSASALIAQNEDELIDKKVDFIVLASNKIYYPLNDTSQFYKIGIYGRNTSTNKIYKALKSRSPGLNIQNKPVRVFHFRRTNIIEPVDIFYVNGESKIRISDIDENLGDYPYVIITENFPYGTSMLNFAINQNNNLHFEMQPDAIWGKGGKIDNKFLNASNRVLSESNWEKILQATSYQLEQEILKSERQKEIIEQQTDEIIKQSEKIDYQHIIILISAAFLFVVSVLVYFLALINKKRKQANKLLAEKNKEITDSIEYAKIIQRALLPSGESVLKSFSDGFIYYQPKDIVSGDFYWHNQFDDTTTLAVADSSGHGVPGAFMGIMGNELFQFVLSNQNNHEPGAALQIIDNKFKESFKTQKDNYTLGIDIVLVSYHKSENTIYYAGANRPLLLVRENSIKVFEPTRKSIGVYMYQKNKYFETVKIATKPGDCFYLFTDGFQDQFGGTDCKKYSKKQFYSLLSQIANFPMKKQYKLIESTFEQWKGNEDQVDDICIIGIKI
ncbi:MAG: DUF4154 domain-containing protein [Bacteroidales bacterium]|nr:DUF4154 domain-containing protein [Bacteroidales bacterium]MBN2819988.1 DUF4154 domain-containing protein [Bacteroidales bacterium]